MHLPFIKALVAVIAGAALAIGAVVAHGPSGNHRPRSAATATATSALESDATRFLGQLEQGHVKPDPALKDIWEGDVTAAAQTLGMSDAALAQALSRGDSLAQIAAMHGVSAKNVTTALVRHFRGDLAQAEHDQSISPTAAHALLDAMNSALGHS